MQSTRVASLLRMWHRVAFVAKLSHFTYQYPAPFSWEKNHVLLATALMPFVCVFFMEVLYLPVHTYIRVRACRTPRLHACFLSLVAKPHSILHAFASTPLPAHLPSGNRARLASATPPHTVARPNERRFLRTSGQRASRRQVEGRRCAGPRLGEDSQLEDSETLSQS